MLSYIKVLRAYCVIELTAVSRNDNRFTWLDDFRELIIVLFSIYKKKKLLLGYRKTIK